MKFQKLIVSTLLTITPVFINSVTLAYADFTGPVVSVLDGDTIEVLHNSRPEQVRLSGIDCPEKGQAYSKHTEQTASK